MKTEHVIINRKDAAASGKRFFYTAEPCKRGHLSLRYTTTGGCVECLQRFRPKFHPRSKDLVPFDGDRLWRSRRLSFELVQQLTPYLQQCIDAFTDHHLPPECTVCKGLQTVPRGDGTNRWKACPACCPDHESVPSGALDESPDAPASSTATSITPED